MTLKRSTHSSTHNNPHNIPIRKLMREDLRRRTWMIALSCLGSFTMSPVAFLFMYSASGSASVSPLSQARLNAAAEQGADMLAGEMASRFLSYFSTIHLALQMFILAVGALIVAGCGFQYLYSRRMVDLYHSTPATRERLFLALWLNGFLIWFVPFALGQISVCILALYYIGRPAFWGGVTLLLCKEFGLFVLCFLILYNASLVAVVISGNAKNAFVNMFIYGFGVLAIYATVFAYLSRYLDTFYLYDNWVYAPPVIALSPFAAPIFLCISFLARIPELFPAGSAAFEASQWMNLLIPSIVMMLVNFGLAMVLYKRRPSELAERGIDNKYFRIPLNFVTSVFCGLWLSLFFSLITENGSLGWALFGAVFGCVLAFACMNILHHTTFKALFAHKLQLAVTLIFTCSILFVFHYDAFGYDTYLPKKDSITGLSFYSTAFSGEGFGIMEYADGVYRQYRYTDMPEDMIFTDQEQNYRLLETLVDTNNFHPEEGGHAYTIHVKVDTTHGSYRRSYVFHTEGANMDALQPFLESDAFREYFHPAAYGMMKTPAHIDIKTIDNDTIGLTDPERVEQLYRAYAQDFTEHFTSDSAITYSNSNRMFYMNYAYPKETANADEKRQYYHLSMNVPVWYEHTSALLKEWYPQGIWSQDDMDIDSLTVSINRAGSTLVSLQEYLGETESSETAELSESAESAAISKSKDSSGSWNRLIEDPAELAALKPYLYIGRYNGNEFILIGKVNIILHGNSEQDSKHTLSCNCYLKRGNIPEGFAESLTFDP